MKVLRFTEELARKILNGTKTVTWRMFDDKDLAAGDEIEFRVSGSDEVVAHGVIEAVNIKTLGTVDPSDYSVGQEPSSPEQLLEEFRGYYGDRVTLDTPLKIIAFKLIATHG